VTDRNRTKTTTHRETHAPTGRLPLGCAKCKKGFDAAVWPRTKFTRSGWSPWCPACHADFAPRPAPYNGRAKPGPKPKRLNADVDND
jgi:hypothetical protein